MSVYGIHPSDRRGPAGSGGRQRTTVTTAGTFRPLYIEARRIRSSSVLGSYPPACPLRPLSPEDTGPLTSLLLGAPFFLASTISGGASGPTLIQATLSWLGMINTIMGLFNLIPAFPLDGGPILQAATTKALNSP